MGDGATRPPDAVCDGGDLDCGSGLLLIIREAMAPLPAGGRLEVRSRESSVREDLPAWCRLVGHTLESVTPASGGSTSFMVAKGTPAPRASAGNATTAGAREAPLEHDLAKARQFSWSARVKWTAGMAATAYVRNHTVPIGQPVSFDTADAAPSAIELLLAALGGCLAVGFRWRASRQQIEVFQLEVVLKARADDILVYLGIGGETAGGAGDGGGDRAEASPHPGLAGIEGTAFIDCDADDETVRALFADTVARSPVAQSLLRGVPLRIEAKRA